MENAAATTAPIVPAATTAATTMVVFADTPQTLGADDLIDYSSKQESDIYKQGIAPLHDKALTDGFNMTANQTVVFTEAFLNCATAMGWNKGSKQITTFTNSGGVAVDIIKSYGQIDEATLKTVCERFCKAGQADAKYCAKQNNMMMSMCLNKSLTASAKASLLTYRAEYTFDGVEYAPLKYKIIMRLATIDSVATTQTLRDNLQNLGMFAVVRGDIDKVNAEFDTNYSQLLARGATLDDPIGILFEAYLLVPCYKFTKYMSTKHDEYLDGNLISLTHEAMMSMAKRKFDFLKTKGKWGAKSPDDEKIVAMAAEINSLKGQLKLDLKLSTIAGEGKKDDSKSLKKKNKKNTSNKKEQKKDEAWKKEPPKAGESKVDKQVGKYTFNWCEHHMAWTVHKPADCLLGKHHKEEQKKPYKAKSATVAAAATSAVNPQFVALMASMANLDQNE